MLGSFLAFPIPACHLCSSSSVFTPLEYLEMFSDGPPSVHRFSTGPITPLLPRVLTARWWPGSSWSLGNPAPFPGHTSHSGSSHQIFRLTPRLFVCCLCMGMCFPPVLAWVGAWHVWGRKMFCLDVGRFTECWAWGTVRVVVL